MIGWMQHNRKYLIVTIWISTIAFVGAGFVGWGSYSMSKSSDVLATVGNLEVSNRSVNNEYSRLFSLYNKQFGGKLTTELAKEIGLERQAFDNIVNRQLLLSYANDLGFYPLKQEIFDSIKDMNTFQKDGVFDQNLYYDTLTQSRLSPKSFEKDIADDLMIQKVMKSISLNNSKLENDGLHIYSSLEDLLDVKVINSNNIKITTNDEILKKYFSQNKDKYQTKLKRKLDVIKVQYIKVQSSEQELRDFFKETKHLYRTKDGKIESFENSKENVQKDINYRATKKIANKIYYEFKKKQRDAESSILVSRNDEKYSQNTLNKIFSANIGTFIKPIAIQDAMLIAFVKGLEQPTNKSYQEAKKEVKENFIKTEKVKKLHELSKVKLKSSDYKRIDYVSMTNIKALNKLGFSDSLANKFLSELFSSDKKQSYIILDDKSLVYKIVKQRYKNTIDDMNSEAGLELKDNLKSMKERYENNKNSVFQNNLIGQLKSRYKVISYIQ